MLVMKQMRRWFPLRFQNRLMLYNTLIFLVVAYALAFLAVRYANQLDTVKQLQASRDALNAVTNFYDRKHDQFVNLLFPLYEDPANYDKINNLLEASSDQDYETDPYLKSGIVSLLQNVTVKDSDIAAILIRKTRTGTNFLYRSQSRTIETVGESFPFADVLRSKRGGRSIYGSRLLGGTLSRPVEVYGIAGELGSQNIRTNAGQILIAYATSPIDKILDAYSGRKQGRFLLLTRSGDRIYDSRGEYAAGPCPSIELLLSGKDQAVIDGKAEYIQVVNQLGRNYIGVNLVPMGKIETGNPGLAYKVYGAITAMAVLCALLYAMAGSIVAKRLHQLVRAMKRVGESDLSYRVPVGGRHDEFGELAIRFNRMTGELQEMIKREYISELRKKNAELHALQAGINPHFLYNTLEAIRIKANDEGNADVAEMIVLLANLYRSIVKDDTFISIRKELHLCGMYIDIFSMRYAGSLPDYALDVEPGIMDCLIPKNLLQPLVENYFVHGLRDREEDNQFAITGRRRGEEIEFVFEDNGRGIAPGRLARIAQDLRKDSLDDTAGKRQSYGLLNVQERIRLVYGKDCGLAVVSPGPGLGTRIVVRIKAQTSTPSGDAHEMGRGMHGKESPRTRLVDGEGSR
ncbi:sensor histidine kinase [Paenibacillus sp. R14(2021)]|uniref:sensor histidine kinase n=1 Tax=Paenibacillus sp. R14(2021) TaxID=2859228 RepID=UPI001C6126F0|nr:histidine kinase [Paenibacillus sp. R14(2021)]